MFDLLAVAALFGVQEAERLVWPVAKGFVVGYHRETASGVLEERIAKGETVTKWTRMITLVTVPGSDDPIAYTDHIASMWENACPGARTSGPGSGRRGVDIRINCRRYPQTGLPETILQRTFAGTGKLYVLQIAFRSVPTPQDIVWASAELDHAILCPAGMQESACR
jgi:hypothetical protein